MPAERPIEARYRRWSFTSYKLENFEKNWEEFYMNKAFKYLIMGYERGAREHREHLQCYIEFYSKKTMDQVKELWGEPSLHCEPSKGTAEQNKEYCSKDGNWKEFGHFTSQGKRSDLEDCVEMIKEGADLLDIAEKHAGDAVRYFNGLMKIKDLYDRKRQKNTPPTPTEVIVFIGKAGSGKTHHAYELAGPDAYKFMCQQSGKVYFDGYDKQKTIWFDEFSGSTMPFHLWCSLVDKWGCRVETKGSSVEVIGLKRVIISTIEYPGEWWANSARFLKDPGQLWRRISKVYFIPGGAGYDRFYKPMLIDKEDWPRICDAYLDNLQTMAVEYEDELIVC